MSPFSVRRSHLHSHLLLLLFLLPPRPAAAEPAASCDSGPQFRPGRENFVLDAEDAVGEGAAPLATAHVRDADACQRACCEDARCNLALLEPPRAPQAEGTNVTCVLFNCVHRNRFVCRFVTHVGYRSFIRESVFRKHLRGPSGGGGESRDVTVTQRRSQLLLLLLLMMFSARVVRVDVTFVCVCSSQARRPRPSPSRAMTSLCSPACR